MLMGNVLKVGHRISRKKKKEKRKKYLQPVMFGDRGSSRPTVCHNNVVFYLANGNGKLSW